MLARAHIRRFAAVRKSSRLDPRDSYRSQQLLTVSCQFTSASACPSLTPPAKPAVGLGFVLGRLYALTILFCIRQRGSAQRERGFNSTSHNTSGLPHKSRTVGGVSVTHQATVTVDDRDEHELASFAGRSGAGQRKQAAFASSPPAPKLYVVGTDGEAELDEKRSYDGRSDFV